MGIDRNYQDDQRNKKLASLIGSKFPQSTAQHQCRMWPFLTTHETRGWTMGTKNRTFILVYRRMVNNLGMGKMWMQCEHQSLYRIMTWILEYCCIHRRNWRPRSAVLTCNIPLFNTTISYLSMEKNIYISIIICAKHLRWICNLREFKFNIVFTSCNILCHRYYLFFLSIWYLH